MPLHGDAFAFLAEGSFNGVDRILFQSPVAKFFQHRRRGRPHHAEGILAAGRNISEKRTDALVLGCTELPLIIREGGLDVTLLDTTRNHIDAILDCLLQ